MSVPEPKEADLEALTAKQREVLDLLIEHKTSKEIARELGISPHTVDQRIDFAKKKLDVQGRGDLALRYRELISMYEPLTYADSRMVRSALAIEGQQQDDAGYYLIQSSPDSTVQGSMEIQEEEFGIVPKMFDGPYGTLVRLGAILAIALGMLMLVLGSLAMFGELSSMLQGS